MRSHMTYNDWYNWKLQNVRILNKTVYNRRVDDVLAGGCFQIVYKQY